MVLTAAGGSDTYVCLSTSKELTTGAGACGGSSLRFKTDAANYERGSDVINQLRPVAFKYKDTPETHLGFIAEEVFEIEPTLIYHDEGSTTTPRGIRYNEMSAIFAKAIQELDAKFAAFASSTPQAAEGSGSFLSSITEWIGTKITATLGVFESVLVKHIEVTNLHADVIDSKQLCLEDICITKEQLQG